MKKKRRELYEARAEVVKALAHPTRLLLLDALGDREMCVAELTKLVGADQSTVSRHLAILKGAGLLVARKEGSMSYYVVSCTCLEGFFVCIESVLKENLKARRVALGM